MCVRNALLDSAVPFTIYQKAFYSLVISSNNIAYIFILPSYLYEANTTLHVHYVNMYVDYTMPTSTKQVIYIKGEYKQEKYM